MSSLPKLDDLGHLENPRIWDEAIAATLAAPLELTPEHWAVIKALRAFYETTEVAPAMRPFVNLIREQVGDDVGNSIRLMALFGESPAREAARIAGLPKPTNCL